MVNFILRSLRIPAGLVVLALAALLFGSDAFGDVNNLDSLQTIVGPLLILVVGMTLLFVVGNFDLSSSQEIGHTVQGVVGGTVQGPQGALLHRGRRRRHGARRTLHFPI